MYLCTCSLQGSNSQVRSHLFQCTDGVTSFFWPE